MLRRLVEASLQLRVVVVLAAGVLLAAGVWKSLDSPLDVFPEFAPPLIEVQAEAPGMSSESVEQLVTIPLEGAVNGVPGMTTIRSKSVQGLASVQILFEPGADMTRARQMVAERAALVTNTLRERGAEAPQLMPPLSSTSRVLKLGITSKKATALKKQLDAPGVSVAERQRLQKEIDDALTEVSVQTEWLIRPKLQGIKGVANTSVYGLRKKQLQIILSPRLMEAHSVKLEQVLVAARRFLSQGSGGFIETGNQRPVIHFDTPLKDPRELGEAVVVPDPKTPVLLKQLLDNPETDIRYGNPPAIGEGVINGQPGLLMVVEKYPEANTLKVTRDLEAAIEELRPALHDVEITTRIFRPATFIELALANLRTAMIIGCILVALILLAFLFEWRTAVISLTAIPLSLVTGMVVMSWLGGGINTMVLAGLVIAIGEVVDDAIIDVENIMRRLRQNQEQRGRASAFQVVLAASLEVRSAVVYASFIVVFVCLPIFFMGGVAGAFFQPLALAYIFAVLASLVVALTVTPALSLWLLPKVAGRSKESPLVRGIKSVYGKVLPAVLNHPRAARFAVAVCGLVAVASLIYPGVKQEYLPRFMEHDFLLHWIAKPGTDLKPMREDIENVSNELTQAKAVTEFGAHIARAELGEEVYGANFAELWISLGEKVDDYEAARKKIETITAQHVWVSHDLLTYLQERIKEVLSGASASVVIRVYGPDYKRLRARADRIQQAIADVPDIIDLRVESQDLVAQWNIDWNFVELQKHGLNPVDVSEQLTASLSGIPVGRIHQEQKAFALVVYADSSQRRLPTDLNQWPIFVPGRGTVPLGTLGNARQANAPNSIRHVATQRCIDVTCNVRGRDLKAVMDGIRQRIQALPAEPGYHVEYLGEYQARAENQQRLLWLGGVAILGIAMLLYIDFKSFRLTLLVLLTLPFALIGGVAVVWLTGGVLSLGSLVGFVTVLGIAARNGIMLVSHYRHLQTEEGMPFNRDLIVRGAMERVSPILMTALAAGLGLLPLALSGNKPGYEVEYPMAVVILGGLFTSTLLNLLVLPVLYERWGKVSIETEEAPTSIPAKSSDGDGKPAAGSDQAKGAIETFPPGRI